MLVSDFSLACSFQETVTRVLDVFMLGNVRRVEDGRIPKDLVFGELASGSLGVECQQLLYKDVCKCDMKARNINTASRELTAENRTLW